MISKADITKAVLEKREELGLKKDDKKIKISKLGLGENNMNFLVGAGKKNFVFRICYEKHGEAHLREEYEWLRKIPKGIGPRPILFDGSKKIIDHPYSVLTYIEGKPAYDWTNRKIILYAKALGRIHRIKSRFAGRPTKKEKNFEMTRFLKKEMGGYIDGSPWLKKDSDIKRFYPRIERFAKDNNTIFKSMKRFSLLHGDPCAPNTLFRKKALRFIDWEWACYGDPAKDISFLFDPEIAVKPWSIKLPYEKRELLLKTYLKINPDKTLRERLKVWHEINLFTAFVFFKWKVKNFHKRHKFNSLPKKKYERGLRLTLKTLKRRFPD